MSIDDRMSGSNALWSSDAEVADKMSLCVIVSVNITGNPYLLFHSRNIAASIKKCITGWRNMELSHAYYQLYTILVWLAHFKISIIHSLVQFANHWKGCFDIEKLCKHCTFKFKSFLFQNKLVSKDQSV